MISMLTKSFLFYRCISYHPYHRRIHPIKVHVMDYGLFVIEEDKIKDSGIELDLRQIKGFSL